MGARVVRTGAALLMVMVAGGPPAFAQPPEPDHPGDQPAGEPPAAGQPTDPEVERIIGDLERARVAPRPTAKAGARSPTTPGATVGGAGRLLAEGTFLSGVTGRIAERGGEVLLVIEGESAEGAAATRSLGLLPNQYFAALERQRRDRGPDALFTVTGQVFVYGGRNHLLLIAPAMAARPTEAATAPTEAAPTDHPAPATPSGGDAAVDRIIGDLDAKRPSPRPEQGIVRSGGAPAEAGSARRATVPEGKFLAGRRGRLVRASGGEWTLVFDSSARRGPADGPTDPPMVVQKCQALTDMEAKAMQRGESLTFTVSGPVFAFHDRNYVLPTIYQANRRDDSVIPTQ